VERWVSGEGAVFEELGAEGCVRNGFVRYVLFQGCGGMQGGRKGGQHVRVGCVCQTYFEDIKLRFGI
jgi:hypothetical protein